MNATEHELDKVLDFPHSEPDCHWALARQEGLEQGDCLIANVSPNGTVSIAGRFDAQSGNVLAPSDDPASPAVLCIGSPEGETGQLKARQAKGNYLRVCRWDRIDEPPALQPDARFRTLPQCGCGGYLGTPKFFPTFAEMSAYVFCMFYA